MVDLNILESNPIISENKLEMERWNSNIVERTICSLKGLGEQFEKLRLMAGVAPTSEKNTWTLIVIWTLVWNVLDYVMF